MSKKHIAVAIGLIVHQGKIVVGWRDEALHQGGRFEFPGGKIEQGETPEQALVREIAEEVGIELLSARLFHQVQHDYGDREVNLYFYICYLDDAQRKKIQNPWQWHQFDQLHSLEFPAANQCIVERLNWNKRIAITAEDQDINQQPVTPLCYVRGQFLDKSKLIPLLEKMLQQGRQIILNVAHVKQLPQQLQQQLFAVHFRYAQMDQMPHYANHNRIVACHQVHELHEAEKQGADAVLYSPVLPTPTHPEQHALGWKTFAQHTAQLHLMVYALGGIKCVDLEVAQQHGAYGVAGIRDFWH